MKKKTRKMCGRCEGKGMWKPPYFSTALEPCKECHGSGSVEVEVDAKRRYICEECRTGFEADFTVKPETPLDLCRTCPSCGEAAFIALESAGDLIRVLVALEMKDG